MGDRRDSFTMFFKKYSMLFFQLKVSKHNDKHIVWERNEHQADDCLYGCADITRFQGEMALGVICTRGDGPLGDFGIDDVGMVDHCARKYLFRRKKKRNIHREVIFFVKC